MARSGSLRTYNRKRNFKKTSEPKGRVVANTGSAPVFTIQRHAASRLHYDFRLELDGVLKSWAVPKGPSLDPKEKRLAVEVEDHPLDYQDFEGEIPKGEYGGGSVLLWDKGTWEPEGDPHTGLKKGRLRFKLAGHKLHGAWTLLRMRTPGEKGHKNWLLVKSNDAEARATAVEDIVVSHPESVAKKRQTKRKKTAKTVEGTPGRLPKKFSPQLATLSKAAPDGERWLHEVKFDGYRLIAICNQNDVRILTRNGLDWTYKVPRLVDALRKLPFTSAVFDGELVALDGQGISRFQMLQNALEKDRDHKLKYYIFDMPFLNDHDLRELPLIKRKELLEMAFKQIKSDVLHYSDHVRGNGKEFFATSCKTGLEGIVSKDINSHYVHRRSPQWLKTKCSKRQEFVIGGFTKAGGSRSGFGALLLGHYQGNDLVYAGRVGTGFTDASLKSISARLQKLKTDKSPFAKSLTSAQKKGATWVKPELVGEVEFTEWTDDGHLRHPSFQGLRLDKPAKVVEREEPMLTKFAGIELSNPDRVLYPEQNIKKYEIASYYMQVAKWILPHLVGRPLSIVRCPRGNDKQCFFQKHFDEPVEELDVIPIKEKNKVGKYVAIRDIAGIIRLTQLGVLEIHPWGCKKEDIEHPDRIVFDLDPGPKVKMQAMIDAALLLKTYLENFDLESFVKTSGGKGLHVVVPLVPKASWDEAKEFTKTAAEHLARTFPDRFVAKMTKSLRPGKIFIDYLRNGRGATSVATFSTRARAGATVATPLAWDELTPDLDLQSFNYLSVPKRLREQKGDPWARFFKIKQALP